MTGGESEVFSLIAEGMSNRQITEWLDIPPFMVRSIIENILDKLALRNSYSKD